MIRSPGTTSRGGALLTNEVFASILSRADWIERAIFTYDEFHRWGRRTMDQLVELGLLREIERASVVRCDDCCEGCFVPAELDTDARTGKMVGYYFCSHEYEGGPKTFDLDEFRQWEFRLDGLAALVAEALGLGTIEPVVPHRVCLLGTLPTGGGPLDIFLACGLWTKDASSVIERASRLRTSAAPVVLVLTRPPRPILWHDVRPTVLVLAEHVSWNEAESRLAVSSLLHMLRSIRPPVHEEAWLTVTECARLVMKDSSYLELREARARVSWAANTAKFATNGKKRDARRIERTSFDAWRLDAAGWIIRLLAAQDVSDRRR